jgi:hypothetical protein
VQTKDVLRFFTYVSLSCCFCSQELFSEEAAEKTVPLEKPWFTGPLLAPTPYTPGAGLQDYQPHVFFENNRDHYNSNWGKEPIRHKDTLTFKPIFKFGITRRTQINVVPELSYKNSEGPNFWRIRDFSVAFYVQALEDNTLVNLGRPDVKIGVHATAPVGKYNSSPYAVIGSPRNFCNS